MVYSSLGPDSMILIINRIFQRGVTLCQTEYILKKVGFSTMAFVTTEYCRLFP